MNVLRVPNRAARWLWLTRQGLGARSAGTPDLARIITDLGYVQLDTIQVAARAHDHILWSRKTSYRPRDLDRLMRTRAVFEHFTHDASVLPMWIYPVWKRQMRRKVAEIARKGWFKSMPDAKGRALIRARIEAEGALSTRDFESAHDGPKEMWSRPPHKLALDYMWYEGSLSTCHREGFTKFYDLTERVIPEPYLGGAHAPHEEVDILCRAALSRIGAGSLAEIRKFWEAADVAEVKAWADGAGLKDVEIEGADGSLMPGLALPELSGDLDALQPPGTRLRILSPFDPVVRDRARLMRLFGFDYRVEMFVPEAKRIWGYYVFPLLEGDRFVGRLEAKADREAGVLNVFRLWSEPGVRWTGARAARLEAELARFARLCGCEAVKWHCSGVPETA